MRSNISFADARDLPFEDLEERVEVMLSTYDKPDVETGEQKLERINRTIDEVPQIYRWLLQLHSWCDHWCDSMNEMFGIKDPRYKALRQRRDFFEKMASAAKMRYEGASRKITIELGFAPDGLPRSRRGE